MVWTELTGQRAERRSGVLARDQAATVGVLSAPAWARLPGAPAAVRDKKRPLATLVYLPACFVAAVALALIAVGASTGFGGTDFTRYMSNVRVVVAGPATLLILGVFLITERVRPAQRRPLIARGHRQDLLYAVFGSLFVVPLVAALSLSFTEVARKALPWIVLPKSGLVPRWVIVALILVAMDGLNWLAHLANHRVLALWRFHEVHHSQEDLNALSVFRTHPLIHFSYLIAMVPGVVLIANGVLSSSLLVGYGAILAFAHSNTNLGFGPLGRVFVSPNFHRIHHMLDGPQDVNLGFALTIWDQMFGRAVFPTDETIRTDTGLPGRPLLVEQAGERPRHLYVLAAQLVGPFRPLNTVTDLPPVRDGSRDPEQTGAEQIEAARLEVASW